MHTRILAALVVCVATSAPVTAGEIKGTGQFIEHRASTGQSACRFSGLNDGYFGDPTAPRTQSFGQLMRQGGREEYEGPTPGEACNPTSEADE
ncbi:hypothetical protein [Microvirga sp. VF16]|uniref:hypothetical protein n=1 Tax=Microvirga sp. VF16 TaxID=2807101 RepID=UPI00193CD2C1|nr:hypothetical protein [Microvirga sp. VF16]QRM35647.1 hypothetical protein JO965_43270 [Microvirga sp. VF16]